MIIHLISGFLGSGKTTAIVQAVKKLFPGGVKCAVITNDQGSLLVDSNFMQGIGVPYGEVTGGCFCCNYDQLETRIWELKNQFNPDVIFAETVGSCTDLVATVLKPLWKFRSETDRVTFSTLVDSRLMQLRLQGKALPFSRETTYIWEKQIEESQILIMNKIDLVNKSRLSSFRKTVNELYGSKKLLFQNSNDPASAAGWLDALAAGEPSNPKSIDVDYEKYARGEANLAWLDETIDIGSDRGEALMMAHKFIERLVHSITMKGGPIGHLKFLLQYNGQSVKVSYTSVVSRSLFRDLPPELAGSVKMLINARIQTSPKILKDLVEEVLSSLKNEPGITFRVEAASAFSPGFPRPTHRITEGF